MKKGDLVRYNWPRFLGELHEDFSKGVGIVLSVNMWQDAGAPERNCGVNVEVHWSTGEVGIYEEDELEYCDRLDEDLN